MPPTRVAVIGAGSFGRNHLRVYRELQAAHPALVELVAVVDPTEPTLAQAAERFHVPGYPTLEALFAAGVRLDAASVCVPTIHHAAVASQLIAAGVDVLIEKPFAASLAEADSVLALAEQHSRIVQIGHLERFNPAVAATVSRLNRPMFFEAHRLSIFTARSLDVDVVLDLMVHDLDIVLSLTQSPVKEVRAVGLPVLSHKTDIANVRVEFESGCVANFTASRISTEQVRKLRLFQPRQYLSLDFAHQELLTIDVSGVTPEQLAMLAAMSRPSAAVSGTPISPSKEAAILSEAKDLLSSRAEALQHPSLGSRGPTARSIPAQGEALGHLAVANPSPEGAAHSHLQHPSPGLTLQKLELEKAEPLRLEIEDFLRAVQTRTAPRVTGQDGRNALALALEINRQIAEHAHRAGLTANSLTR